MSRFLLITMVIVAVGCSRGETFRKRSIAAAGATTEWLSDHYGFVSDPALDHLLARVTTRLQEGIVTASAVDFPSLPNEPWTVYVLRLDEPNAFSSTGGVIYLSRGLVHTLGSEAQLAAVISHEMAHGLLGHADDLLAAATSKRHPLPANPVFAYSLDQELAADNLALHILKAAHYDLREAISPLTLGYRSPNHDVSSEKEGELSERLSRLMDGIRASGDFLPATRDTREFQQVRAQL